MAQRSTGELKNGVVVFGDGTPPLSKGSRLKIEVVEAARPLARTLAERLASVVGRADGLPDDLAAQHDHYLHGQPKRSRSPLANPANPGDWV
jgi:hypothetical protein